MNLGTMLLIVVILMLAAVKQAWSEFMIAGMGPAAYRTSRA